jgi:hypothetical protein
MNDNIIKFPKLKKEQEKTFENFEEFEDLLMKDVKEEADESAEFLWACVLMDMSGQGFELNRASDDIKVASILILEAIRSLHYLSKGIEHPLQDVAKELFDIEVVKDE